MCGLSLFRNHEDRERNKRFRQSTERGKKSAGLLLPLLPSFLLLPPLFPLQQPGGSCSFLCLSLYICVSTRSHIPFIFYSPPWRSPRAASRRPRPRRRSSVVPLFPSFFADAVCCAHAHLHAPPFFLRPPTDRREGIFF